MEGFDLTQLGKKPPLDFEMFAGFINPIVIFDTAMRVLFVNTAFEKLTHFSPEDVIGKESPLPWAIKGSSYQSHMRKIKKALSIGNHYINMIQDKYGNKLYIAITFTPVVEDGQIVCYVSVWYDLTRQQLKYERVSKELYQKEKTLRRALQREGAARIRFFRWAMHELKTPLASMDIASELLCEEVEEEHLVKLAKNVRRGVNSLKQRIDEITDLAKGKVGMIKLDVNEEDILALLYQIADDMSVVAMRGDKSLNVELPAYLPKMWCDKHRVRQILTNVLDNALKYTNRGDIINLQAYSDNRNIIVNVKDSGPGICKARQQTLFRPYYDISDENPDARITLGLPLCKLLTELHGGHIRVDSILGQGTTVNISLPIKSKAKIADLENSEAIKESAPV